MCDLKLLFGIAAYVAAVVAAFWTAAFLGNVWIARTIDAAAIVPLGQALLVNAGLVLLFALQHGGMARRPVSSWLSRMLGQCHVRSIYVMATSVMIVVVLTFWQPIGGVVWMIQNQFLSRLVYFVYFGGWLLIVYATFLLDHFELFGLRQSWTAHLGGQCTDPILRTPGLYRYVRHPIYTGWLLVLWAAPVMTVSHLLFAAGLTIYILIGIQIEERDLTAEFTDYPQYQRKVPMLLPSFRRKLSDSGGGLRSQGPEQWL